MWDARRGYIYFNEQRKALHKVKNSDRMKMNNAENNKRDLNLATENP